MSELVLARGGFDIGLLTNRGEEMLAFWHRHLELPLEDAIRPFEAVTQFRLSLGSAILKLNHVEANLPTRQTLGGLRMLLLADPNRDVPAYEYDPDGNLICFVPPGTAGVRSFGVHLAVSDEDVFHDFFGRILAFPQVADRVYDIAGASVSFSWSPVVVQGLGSTGIGFDYLTLQVLDVVAAHSLLCERGAREVAPPSMSYTTTDSTISFISDPDGTRIELSQRPDLVSAVYAE